MRAPVPQPSRSRRERRPPHRWVLLTLTLLAALLLGATRDLSRASETRWALLIGVDAYDDPAILDLQYADDDARALARQLGATGDWPADHIIVMTPDQPDRLLRPTRANILRQLRALEGVTGDQLFFAFSGHGVAERGPEGRANLLLPMDASVSDLAETTLTLESVELALEATGVSRRFLVFDACRGNLTRTRALDTPWVSPTAENADGTIVMYGTKFGGVSFEDDEAQLGALTASLVEALAGNADGRLAADGEVSWNEACLYVQDRLRLRSVHTGQVQEPTCGGEWSGGDFGLVRTPPGMAPIVSRQDWSRTAEPTRHVARFDSKPEGATIYVDGNELCTTPCQRALVEGAHVVETRLRRYSVDRRSFEVAPQAAHEVTLSPLFGWLEIDSAPSNLRVALDGEFAGKTPLTIELEPGTYRVTLDEEAWMPSGVSVTLRAAERRAAQIPAEPRRGALAVEVRDDAGNDRAMPVAIDGRAVGTTPWQGELQVGRHRVLVGEEAREVIIHEAQTTPLEVLVTGGSGARATATLDLGEDEDLFTIPLDAQLRRGHEDGPDIDLDAPHLGRLGLPSENIFMRMAVDVNVLSDGSARYTLWAETAEGEDPTDEQQAALEAYAELHKPTIGELAPLNVPMIDLMAGANLGALRYGFHLGYGWATDETQEVDGLSYGDAWAFQLGLMTGLQLRWRQLAPYLEYKVSALGVFSPATGAAGTLSSGAVAARHGPRLGTEIGFGEAIRPTLDVGVDWLPGPYYQGYAIGVGVVFGGL